MWFVPSRKGQSPRELTITNVGAKWVACGEDGRIDRKTLRPESLDGVCYPSREAWEQERALKDAWDALAFMVQCGLPRGVSLEQVQAARKILGLDISIQDFVDRQKSSG